MDDAAMPIDPGLLVTIGHGALQVTIAPYAGGRVAQIRHAGVDHLVDHDAAGKAAIAWGCYPMVPWAGRLREGRFRFDGRDHAVPVNLGAHAIHGVGFTMPWRVQACTPTRMELVLALPDDERWPFGGTAHQTIEASGARLDLTLSLHAGAQAMPAALGWHPWFRKPTRVDFRPDSVYPRDASGLATLPLASPPPRPWDDCFLHRGPIALDIDGQRLQLESDCRHWVVYDEPPTATCIEPQSGPPDAFNIEPFALAAGHTLQRSFVISWDARGPES